MRVLLLFPPQHFPLQPHLGMPTVVAYLQQQGFDVVQRDVNVLAYDHFLSPGEMRRALERIERRPLRREISGVESRLGPLSLHSAPYLIEEIDNAKRVMRDRHSFYDFERMCWAKNVIDWSLDVVSDAYAPTRYLIDYFGMGYSNRSSAQVLRAVEDGEQNMFVEYYKEHFIPIIKEVSPQVVGISVSVGDQIIPTFTLCKAIREYDESIHITLGGSTTTRLAESFVRSEGLARLFDTAMLYESEVGFAELLRRLEEGQELYGTPNLVYREKGAIRWFQRKVEPNMNDLPTPTFDGLPLEKYFSPEPILPVLTSRRCYYDKCTFCEINHAWGEQHRQRSPERVVEDLRTLSRKYNTSLFKFVDEALPPAHIRKFCDAIIDGGLKISWDAYVIQERQFASPEFVGRMAEAGCKALHYGLESASPRVADLMKKGIDLALTEQILRTTRDAGILTHIWIIFGFPTEEEADAQVTKDFVWRLHAEGLLDSIEINAFSLTRYSPVGLRPADFGIAQVHKEAGDDLALSYDYEVARGLSQQRAREVSSDFRRRLREAGLGTNLIMEILGPHRIAYAAHSKLRSPSVAAKELVTGVL